MLKQPDLSQLWASSVRGRCPRGCVSVPFSCCDRADHSCGCAPLQRCLFSSPLFLRCCSLPEIFQSRLGFQGVFCQGFENSELQTMSPIPILTPLGWGWSSAAQVLCHAHACPTSKAPEHSEAVVQSSALGLGSVCAEVILEILS